VDDGSAAQAKALFLTHILVEWGWP
jgi:hypothetical protein